MLRCDQCGFDNRDTDKFCSQCGAPLAREAENDHGPAIDDMSAADTQPVTPSFMPPPVTPSFSSDPPSTTQPRRNEAPVETNAYGFNDRTDDSGSDADPEWKMSSLGPPPPPKRRLWLWIVLGLLIACVVVCCAGFAFFSFTGTGQDLLEDWGTQISEQATEQAR